MPISVIPIIITIYYLLLYNAFVLSMTGNALSISLFSLSLINKCTQMVVVTYFVVVAFLLEAFGPL